MGYQEITIPTGFSLYCVTFRQVGGGEFDIQGAEVWQNGTKYDNSSATKFTVQKMKMDDGNQGYYDSEKKYCWRNRDKWGWHKSSTYLEGADQVTLKNGEGLSFYNNTGAAVQLRISGEVDLHPVSMEIPTGFSLIGNMTPNTLDLQDIEVQDLSGNKIDVSSATKITIQKMKMDDGNQGYYDSEKKYCWRNRDKWGWHKSSTYLEGDNAVYLTPGEAVSFYNNNGAPLRLIFKSPVAK